MPFRFVSPAAACGALWLGLFSGGCKRSPAPGPAPKASVSAQVVTSALPQPVEPTRCKRLGGFGLTLEPEAPAPSKPATNDDEDDDALMPFGVDLGAAVPTPTGFAVAGVRGAGQAFVALLGEQASRRVELGELHGDTEPPALAAAADKLLVAMRSSDAAGFTIKLGQVVGAGGIEWGHELSKLGKSVSGLELASSGAGAVLVYQGEEKHSARVLLGSFSVADPKQPFEVKPLEAKDVELPRLVARAGGYWLTWVRSLPEPKSAPKPPKPVASAEQEDPEERELLEQGLRVVEVVKLDEQGKLVGAALRVGEPRRQVILFDVAPLSNGGLLVAARSDSAAPGAEGGALSLSEIGPDGSVHAERLDDDEIGAGVPVLLTDERAKVPQGPWLSVSSPSDATRLGLARGERTYLATDPLLERAEVLAIGGGHILTQRARGRAVELSALDCELPTEPPAPAPPAPVPK